MMNKYAFSIGNTDFIIPFCYPGEKTEYQDWFRVRQTKAFNSIKDKNYSKKFNNIRLGGWNTKRKEFLFDTPYDYDVKVIYADFDSKNIKGKLENIEAVIAYLDNLFPHTSISFKSISGNGFKTMFFIKTPKNYSLTSLDCIEFLKEELPDLFFDCIDKSTSALQLTFVNNNIIQKIQKCLTKIRYSSLPLLEPTYQPAPISTQGYNLVELVTENEDSFEEPSLNNLSKEDEDSLESFFKGYEDVIEPTKENELQRDCYQECEITTNELIKLDLLNVSPTFKKFLGMLKCSQSLVGNGFGISTPLLAKSLNISQRYASKIRQKAVNLGLIKCIDPKYIPKIKAKIYIACNEFKQIICDYHNLSNKLIRRKKKFLDILDGKWYTEIWNRSKYFINDLSDYFTHIDKLKGIDLPKKRRRRIAFKAIEMRLKYKYGDNWLELLEKSVRPNQLKKYLRYLNKDSKLKIKHIENRENKQRTKLINLNININ